MLNYMSTLPMWVQLTMIFGGLIIGAVVVIGIIYRLVKYGIRVKIGPAEIDATEENEEKK